MVSDWGLSSANRSPPPAPGSGRLNRWSYNRTSAGTACSADTQWSVAFGRRPSGALPPRVAGSYLHRSSTTRPAASLTTSVQVTKYADRSRTSRPGARRKNFGGGSSMKSSRSIHSSRVNATWRVPADGSSGLLTTSIFSTRPSG